MKASLESNPSTGASRNIQGVMRQHPLFFFFLMSYAFTWIVLIPYILSVWGVIKGNFDFLYIIKPFVGPTLAAVIMTYITDGKEGLLRLRTRLGQRHASWQWYLLILATIPAIILLGIVVQPGTLASFQGITPRLLVTYPLYFAIVFFGVALPEEIGWRGFALPRMQLRYGPLWGTLLLGVLWCFWHLIFFLTPAHGGGPGANFTTLLVSFAYFLVMVLALSIIFTWIFNHTGGSIFMANLLHASIDTPQLVLIPLFLAIDETRLNLASLFAFGVPAILIVVLTRGRLGYQPGESPEALESEKQGS
jgi:membrane protease YdiL (CAAX protease family)